MMNYLKKPYAILLLLNLLLIIVAYNGYFEGKDLLPVVIGTLTVLFSLVFLLIKRKALDKSMVIGLVLVLISALGVNHFHFNVFSAEKSKTSRDRSIQVLVGNTAPTITFAYHINFKDSIKVASIFSENKYTVLNFWATWCPPCLKEMPILEAFYKENKDKKIGMIGFTDYQTSSTNELSKISKLVEKLNISYPILIDTTKNVRSKYQADILPATVLIDNQGKVLDYQIGIKGAEKILQFVKENTSNY